MADTDDIKIGLSKVQRGPIVKRIQQIVNMENYVRLDVYAAIDSEREYQDAGKGNAKRHEDNVPMSPGEYLLCMEKCLADARDVWYRPDGGAACLPFVRKVAALGVACMELYGAPHREV